VVRGGGWGGGHSRPRQDRNSCSGCGRGAGKCSSAPPSRPPTRGTYPSEWNSISPEGGPLGGSVFGSPMRGGPVKRAPPGLWMGGYRRNFLPPEMRGGRTRVCTTPRQAYRPSLTPSDVQVSGCWSIRARYASIRRVPTGILRVLPETDLLAFRAGGKKQGRVVIQQKVSQAERAAGGPQHAPDGRQVERPTVSRAPQYLTTFECRAWRWPFPS
jgi:hypothetical protein